MNRGYMDREGRCNLSGAYLPAHTFKRGRKSPFE